MKYITEGKHPLRPSEMSSAARCGDARWNMLLACWNMKADSRPTASKVRDMVSQKPGPISINTEIHPPRLIFYLDCKSRIFCKGILKCCRLIVMLPAYP